MKTITITEFESNLHDYLEEKKICVIMNGAIYELKITKKEQSHE